MDFTTVFISLLSGLNLWQLYINFKTRKAATTVVEADANKSIRELYVDLLADVKNMREEYRSEMDKVKKELEYYKARCGNCQFVKNEKA